MNIERIRCRSYQHHKHVPFLLDPELRSTGAGALPLFAGVDFGVMVPCIASARDEQSGNYFLRKFDFWRQHQWSDAAILLLTESRKMILKCLDEVSGIDWRTSRIPFLRVFARELSIPSIAPSDEHIVPRSLSCASMTAWNSSSFSNLFSSTLFIMASTNSL